ncbi:MAG: PilZ domain-containing protein [Chthonomonadales bacterium]
MNGEHGLPPDRRSALRQAIRPMSVKVRDHQGAEQYGELLEISRAGVRCTLPADLPVGSQVLIEAPEGFELRPVRGTVTRRIGPSAHQPDAVEYGIRFTDEAEVRRHTWWLTLRKVA